MLETIGVPRSTYNNWKRNGSAQKKCRKREQLIIGLCQEHKYRYGYRKITFLANKVMHINKNTVQKIMQQHQVLCRVRPKKRKRTGQPLNVAANILAVNFQASRPLEKLATDITYLPFGKSMLYLSSIMDLYNGEIIAYTISSTQDLACVLDTLAQLPQLTDSCILHSDQGAVYTSYSYQQQVQKKGITMSMSRKGTPSDNAPIECFHSSLKHETFYLEPIPQGSNAIVSQTVVQYIKYYNELRIQEKLGYLSPYEYRKLYTS